MCQVGKGVRHRGREDLPRSGRNKTVDKNCTEAIQQLEARRYEVRVEEWW